MALKILIPGVDFPVNVPEKPDNQTLKAEPPPVRPAVQASKETLAREQVAAIEAQALALGWEPDQLEELTGILKIYMPNCKIGEIWLRAIQIVHFYPDGTIRSYANFNNMRVEQPWIKKAPPQG